MSNSNPSLGSRLSPFLSLSVLAGVAYGTVRLEPAAVSALWNGRARYICSDLVEAVGTLVVEAGLSCGRDVGRALQQKASRIDTMTSEDAASYLGSLIAELGEAIEPTWLSARELVSAACALHALGAAREIASAWAVDPTDPADYALQAESTWLASVDRVTPRASDLLGLFSGLESLEPILTWPTQSEAESAPHLRWALRWLAARGDLAAIQHAFATIRRR